MNDAIHQIFIEIYKLAMLSCDILRFIIIQAERTQDSTILAATHFLLFSFHAIR